MGKQYSINMRLTFSIFLQGESMNAVSITTNYEVKFFIIACRGQQIRSAIDKPCHGKTTFMTTVSPHPGKCPFSFISVETPRVYLTYTRRRIAIPKVEKSFIFTSEDQSVLLIVWIGHTKEHFCNVFTIGYPLSPSLL